jgi:uncharacterized Ntn-hydrolase superfamily protein
MFPFLRELSVAHTRPAMLRVATFSIVAYDPVDVAWGIAVASKFPAVGAVVPWAEAAAGAVATQSYANTSYGPKGLGLMREGQSAELTLQALLDQDPHRNRRQVGLVDAQGQPASFTGAECLPWAGGMTGRHFAAQGNILAGPQVVDAMGAAYDGAPGDLAQRLLAALLAGDAAGGDRRGRQSAALFVVRAQAGYGGFNDRWIDYRVDDDPSPLVRLCELLRLHHLYFGKSAAEDTLPLEGDVARSLVSILRRHAGYAGEPQDRLDPPAQQALRAFIGRENFEDRTDFDTLRIDRPVFEFLVERYGL